MEPDSVEFLNLIAERLSEPDTSISDAQYLQNLLDTIMNSNSVFMNLIMPEEKGGGAYTVSPDLGIGRYWQIWFTEPGNFVWTSADPPDKTIASELLTVSDPGRHNILNFRNGSDLVQTISNGDERWFRAATQTDINDVFYLGFGIFQFMRFWYDEAELESLWSGIVIPDDGRSREEIALAWAQAHEEVCLHVTEGSKYARTFVDVRNVAAYVPGPERFSDMDAETVIPFEYETVLVLENPDDISAMSVLMAGNTVEYDGSDAPSGAYKYYRNGYLHLSDDGWSCNGVGTGW